MSVTARGAARSIVALTCLGLLSSACGGGGSAGRTSDSPAASASTSADGTIDEDLSFSGVLAGHMTRAHRGDTYVCAGTGGSYVAGPIVGDVGGKEVSLSITKLSFHGAGTYPGGGVSFDVNGDHYYPGLGNAGTLVVGSDLRSGTVDVSLAVNSDPNTVVGHVSGSWRCPPDAF